MKIVDSSVNPVQSAKQMYECGHCHVRYDNEDVLMGHLAEHQQQMQQVKWRVCIFTRFSTRLLRISSNIYFLTHFSYVVLLYILYQEQLQQQVELQPQEVEQLIAGTEPHTEEEPSARGMQKIIILQQPDGTQQTIVCDANGHPIEGNMILPSDLEQLLQQMGTGSSAGEQAQAQQ